ncbi:hypothetical protein AB1Y20_022627 [Prymnesium parvum]|uniref:Mannosyltransferase n=1 Tax=Prymnesium parvum TaxID=97485 RepID=A0AB34JJL2_PRYPA
MSHRRHRGIGLLATLVVGVFVPLLLSPLLFSTLEELVFPQTVSSKFEWFRSEEVEQQPSAGLETEVQQKGSTAVHGRGTTVVKHLQIIVPLRARAFQAHELGLI